MPRDTARAWERARRAPAAPAPTGPARAGAIQIIHVAKAQLGLDDEAYRALLARTTGKTSCRDMSFAQLDAVLAEMKRLGWKKAPAKAAGRARLADSPQARKIRALWITLHQEGAVRNASEQALDRFVKRMTGVDSLRFLAIGQGAIVIEALQDWLRRARSSSPADEADDGQA